MEAFKDGEEEFHARFAELAAEADGFAVADEFDDGNILSILPVSGKCSVDAFDFTPAKAARVEKRTKSECDAANVASATDDYFAENGHKCDGDEEEAAEEEWDSEERLHQIEAVFVELRAVYAAEAAARPDCNKRDEKEGDGGARCAANFEGTAELAHPCAGRGRGEVGLGVGGIGGKFGEAVCFAAGAAKSDVGGRVHIVQRDFFCAVGADDFHAS